MGNKFEYPFLKTSNPILAQPGLGPGTSVSSSPPPQLRFRNMKPTKVKQFIQKKE